MRSVRGQSDPAPRPTSRADRPDGHRMNLLLSYGGWESDPWVERIPRLLEPMGIRSVRATSGKTASEVIRSTPIHVAVVDLGLPLDEGEGVSSEAGPRVLQMLTRLSTRPPTLVVKRSRASREDEAELFAALRAGAFAVLDRPRGDADLELLLDVLRRIMQRHYAGRWPTPPDPSSS